MSRRLLLSYLSLTIFVLVVLEVPLGVSYQRNERHDLATKVERDAVALASLSEDTLEGGPGVDRAALAKIADRYEVATGGRVVVVDAQGNAVVDTNPLGPGLRSFASRPEIKQALAGQVATGVRHSNTLGTDLLYVAVPVASSGIVHGAVRITYPMSAVQTRIRRYWLILAAIAAIILAVVGAVGLLLARSFARPIAHVERAAAAVGHGDLSVRAPTDEGPPEVRSLAGSFNETVGKLDELIRSREAFVADASHQLRTPLAALRLRLENLERDVTPEAQGDLDAALGEVGRLSRLVDGLLALARTDSTTSAPTDIDLEQVVHERLDAWNALAEEQSVVLRSSVEPRLRARATTGKLEQILDNLLANALDVSKPGACITISTARVGSWVEIHVIDDGPGMSDEAASPRLRSLLARRIGERRLRPRACDRRAPRRLGRWLGRAASGAVGRHRRRGEVEAGAAGSGARPESGFGRSVGLAASRTERALESPDELRLLGRGEACLRVDDLVLERRHLAFLSSGSGLQRGLLGLAPFGEVEGCAPLVHVFLDEPRDRGDVRVPRPDRLVRVAVVARSDGELAGSRAVPFRLLLHGRVRVRPSVRDRLDQEDEGHDREPRPEKQAFHTQSSKPLHRRSIAGGRGGGIGGFPERVVENYGRAENVRIVARLIATVSVIGSA